MPKRSLVRYMAARGFKDLSDLLGHTAAQARQAGNEGLRRPHDGRGAGCRARAQATTTGFIDGLVHGRAIGAVACRSATEGRIRNIVTVASPIDMRGGGLVAGVAQIVNKPAKLIRKYTDLRLNMLKPELFHTPGFVTTIVFKLTDPMTSVTTYWDLITNL